MLYGIEQSTDMRCPRTVVKKFTSKATLLKWVNCGGNYTFNDPEGARNFHRSFRAAYELSGRINKSDPIFKDRGSRDYPRNATDNLASYIFKNGLQITTGESE